MIKKILCLLGALTLISGSAFAKNISLTYPGIKNFSRINTSGSWQITIKQGKTYKIKVITPEDDADNVEVMEEDGTLFINEESSGFWHWIGHKKLRAEIVMPKLKAIETSGSGKTTFNGFHSRNMEISTSGSGNIKGTDNKIKQLILRTSGSSDIDLAKSTIKNADIRISGSSDIELTMNGGNLSGDISGSGSITYYGKAKAQSIRISGSGNVTHRDDKN